MKIAILDDYQHAIRQLDCFQLLADHDVTIVHDYIPDPETLAHRITDTEVLILNRTRTQVGAVLLDLLPHLKLVSQTGKNAGHIDVEACNQRGVAIAEGKGDPTATAELTWAMIMNGLRQIPQAISGMKEGKWQTNIGRRVKDKRIGIYGYGKIGKRIALFAKTFGAEAVIWGSEASRIQAVADGYAVAPNRKAFFADCDVISLHLRLKAATTHIVKLADLQQMKPSALLVNTARAALMEPNALLTALREGKPGFAAIDVFDEEPIFDTNHPLLSMPNVICTPHLGYVEQAGYELYFEQAFANVLAFANGKPVNIANTETLK